MQPMGAGAAAGIAVGIFILLFYLAMFVGMVVWSIYVAVKLRDTAAHLETMSRHDEQSTRNLGAIAAALAQIAARETPPQQPPAA